MTEPIRPAECVHDFGGGRRFTASMPYDMDETERALVLWAFLLQLAAVTPRAQETIAGEPDVEVEA